MKLSDAATARDFLNRSFADFPVRRSMMCATSFTRKTATVSPLSGRLQHSAMRAAPSPFKRRCVSSLQAFECGADQEGRTANRLLTALSDQVVLFRIDD